MSDDINEPLKLTADGECPECFAGIESGDGHSEGCSHRKDLTHTITDTPLQHRPFRISVGKWYCDDCSSFVTDIRNHKCPKENQWRKDNKYE